ncbi:hypothetical protein ES705_38418 [subsurface metagenome]
MTNKDYIKLAALINKRLNHPITIPVNAVDEFIDELCGILQDDNPRFDKEQFITACK